jgi:hypothetical protein
MVKRPAAATVSPASAIGQIMQQGTAAAAFQSIYSIKAK